MVSVIVPVYNREGLLNETINSILVQTYLNWELLLVDDGSTDNSIQVAEEFAENDTRIRNIKRNREPKGAPTCRNIGLENAKGEYVIFLDSDDLMAPYCLEQRLNKVGQFPNQDFWVFPMLIFENQIDDTRRLTNYNTEELDLHRFLRSDIVWTISCPIWKKSSLLRLGGFDESFPNCQDHELHLRALFERLSYQKFLDERPDTFYRKHDGEKIYQPSNPLRVLTGVRVLFEKLGSRYSNEIKADPNAIKNLNSFLFRSLRSYMRNGEFSIPKDLMNVFSQYGIISSSSKRKFWTYITLSSWGLNKIRGYERLWNILVRLKSFEMTWGQRKYEGDL